MSYNVLHIQITYQIMSDLTGCVSNEILIRMKMMIMMMTMRMMRMMMVMVMMMMIYDDDDDDDVMMNHRI